MGIQVAAQEADPVSIRPGCVAAFADAEGSEKEEEVTCVFELRAAAATSGVQDWFAIWNSVGFESG